jgi:hypothetical protein
MVRNFLSSCAMALLMAFHSVVIASAVFSIAAAFGQAPPPTHSAEDVPFENLLNQFETTELTTARPADYDLLAPALEGYRAIKTKNARALVEDAKQEFMAECTKRGGNLRTVEDWVRMLKDYAEFRGETQPDPLYGQQPIFCMERSGQALGAMATSTTLPMENGTTWATILVFNKQGASDMLQAHANGQKSRAQQDIERERLSDLKLRKDANRAMKKVEAIEAWRKVIKVGDDTQCGFVIEVRGPMIQVALGPQAAWARLEQLFPGGEGQCDIY